MRPLEGEEPIDVYEVIHVADSNLGLELRPRIGVGTPRGLLVSLRGLVAQFVAMWTTLALQHGRLLRCAVWNRRLPGAA